MNADRYLAAARTSSLVLLVTVYLSVDIARSNLPRLMLLADAREALASLLVEENVRIGPSGELEISVNRRDSDWWWRVPEVDGRASALMPRFNAHLDLPGIGRIFVMQPRESGVLSVIVLVQRRDGRRWIVTTPIAEPGTVGGLAGAPRLRDIALELSLEPKADNLSTFRAIEYELIDRRVDISGAGIALRSDLAPWLITIFNLGLLIMIRNHVRRVLTSTESEAEEPWLLLDGHVGLERVAALSWLAALVAAPWISSAALLMTLAARVQVDGSITSAATDTGLIVLALSLVIAGGWVALTLAADVMGLRAERRESLKLDVEAGL
jgi:hypothetical protein